jgi:hypothetical protein
MEIRMPHIDRQAAVPPPSSDFQAPREVLLDEGIAELVEQLWKHGFETVMSDEGGPDAEGTIFPARIGFRSHAIAQDFVRIASGSDQPPGWAVTQDVGRAVVAFPRALIPAICDVVGSERTTVGARHPEAAAAYHEAGHAVAAARLGHALERVSIDGDAAVICSTPALPPGHEQGAWLKEETVTVFGDWAVVHLAGAAAATIGAGVAADESAESDFHRATDLLDYLSDDPDDTRRLVTSAAEQADRLTRESWSEIELVASALVEQRTLSAEEVVALVYSAS